MSAWWQCHAAAGDAMLRQAMPSYPVAARSGWAMFSGSRHCVGLEVAYLLAAVNICYALHLQDIKLGSALSRMQQGCCESWGGDGSCSGRHLCSLWLQNIKLGGAH